MSNSQQFMLDDLARSGLVPDDFPVPPVPLDGYGTAAYRISYPGTTFYKDRYDREERRYLSPPGVSAELFWCCDPEEFRAAAVTATVEGAKKALAFYVATGIPTVGIDSVTGWAERSDGDDAQPDNTDENGDVLQRVLRLDLRRSFGVGKRHYVLIDGDWATNRQVARELGAYVWEATQCGSSVEVIDLGVDSAGRRRGADDWLVGKFGAREGWPDADTVVGELAKLPRVADKHLDTGGDWFLQSDERFNNAHTNFEDKGNCNLMLRIMGRGSLKYLTDLKQWAYWDKGARAWQLVATAPIELVNQVSRHRALHAKALYEQAAAYAKLIAEGGAEAAPVAGPDGASVAASKPKPTPDAAKLKALLVEAKAWERSATQLGNVLPRKSVLADASARLSLQATRDAFDPDGDVLAVAGGQVVDLRTGVVRTERREDLILLRCAVGWTDFSLMVIGQLSRGAARMRQFLEEITSSAHGVPDLESAEYLRARLGAALRGRCSLGSLELFVGEGANGKSVLVDCVRAALGGYAGEIKSDALMSAMHKRDAEAASPFLFATIKKRVVVCVESSDTDYLDVGTLKRLTGVNDKLTVRGNYMGAVSVTITSTFFLMTNDLPRVKQGDAALWDRLAVFDFACRWARDGVQTAGRNGAAVGPAADLWVRDQMPVDAGAGGALEYLLWWMVSGGVRWENGGGGRTLGKSQRGWPQSQAITKMHRTTCWGGSRKRASRFGLRSRRACWPHPKGGRPAGRNFGSLTRVTPYGQGFCGPT